MCSDEASERSDSEPTEGFSDATAAQPAPAGSEPTLSWNRRTFLKAAALGAAAAALVNTDGAGRLHFGAASVLADELSGLNCTANDVRIVGPGIILNEPCNCSSSKFDANVAFHIINNTGTARYCVTVHLCATTINGVAFPQTDIVVGDLPANFDGTKTVTIKNYPCGSGLVCFGAAGSQPDGSFLKGEACPAGQCCTTITWNVKASDPCPDTTRQISSKCRHQQVCIQGRSATLTCESNCTPGCGGVATLKLCASGGTKPYTFSLSDGTTTYTPKSATADCALFDVTVTTSLTCTGTVTDSGTPACAKQSNPITLTAQPVAAPVLSKTGPDCSGSVTITADPCDASLIYTFKEGSTTLTSSGCSSTSTFAPGPHTVTVTASNSANTCSASTSISFTVNSPVAVALAAPQSDCTGAVTLVATASGGSGSYSFSFSPAGSVSGSGSTRTLTLPPQLDGQCRTVTATVTDSAGCSATSSGRSFSQCVTTTTCP